MEKFEATVKEVANLKECYEQNIIRWKGEATNGEHARSKRCSSSPDEGIKKSHRKHNLA